MTRNQGLLRQLVRLSKQYPDRYALRLLKAEVERDIKQEQCPHAAITKQEGSGPYGKFYVIECNDCDLFKIEPYYVHGQ